MQITVVVEGNSVVCAEVIAPFSQKAVPLFEAQPICGEPVLVSSTVILDDGFTENMHAVCAAVGVAEKSRALASTLEVA